MYWLAVLLLTVLLAGGPGYARAQQAGKPETPPAPQSKSSGQVAKPAPAAKGYSQEARRAYEEKAAEELKIMQKKLEDLRGKQGNIRPQLRKRMLRGMVNLDKGFYGAKSMFAAMQKAPAQDWVRYKAALDRAMAKWAMDYVNVAAYLQ